jgi:hypothetical protein
VDQIEVWEQAVDVLRECGVFRQQDKDMEFYGICLSDTVEVLRR